MGSRQAVGAGTARLDALDAARGCAMVLVCFSHFAIGYFGTAGAAVPGAFLLTKVASPTFMLLSGVLVGLLCELRKEQFASVRAKLVDRGLFLLSVGHLVILLAHATRFPDLSQLAAHFFITDTIALTMLMGPFLVRRLAASVRVVLGAALLAASWVAVFAVQLPEEAVALRVVQHLLVGTAGESTLTYNFPFLPWIGWYLAFTALGTQVARWLAAGRDAWAGRAFFGAGLGCVALAVGLKGGFVLARYALPAALVGPLDLVTTLTQKLPPSPVYLLGFGGLGLLMTGTLWQLAKVPALTLPMRVAQCFGRNSLFVFIAQFFLYFVAFPAMALQPGPLWLPICLASVALLGLSARSWEARGYNRFFTVGAGGVKKGARPAAERGGRLAT